MFIFQKHRIVKLLINLKNVHGYIIFELLLHYTTNVNNMRNLKRILLISGSILILTATTTSCARKNAMGCPGFSKIENKQINKKNV